MFLLYANGEPFATGMATYGYDPNPGSPMSSRIVIDVKINGTSTEAILDTAAPYVVCSPDIAEQAGLNPSDSFEDCELTVRGIKLKGGLQIASITFVAAEGKSLSLEATVFVPDPEKSPIFDLPSFIGLVGCLERIRFAVDPFSETFYFGPHPSETVLVQTVKYVDNQWHDPASL